MITSRTAFVLCLSLLFLSSQAMSRTNIVGDSVKCVAWEDTLHTVDSLRYRISLDGSQPTVTVMDAGYGSRVPVLGDSTFIVPGSVTIGGRDYPVRRIGRQAFVGHPEIKHLVISEGTEIVSDDAFAYCLNLESISLPATLEILAPASFRGCSGVESISIAEGNGTYDSREGCNAIIETDRGTLVLGCKAARIPRGVTAIGECAFAGQQDIGGMAIPEGVKALGCRAFADCTGLRHISLPQSLQSIGEGAFEGCASLEEVAIPEGVREIGNSVVAGCARLGRLTVSPKNKWYDSRKDCNAIISTQEDCLVAGCGNSVIPEGVRSIGEKAFSSSAVSSIHIPASVTQIARTAFLHCRLCSSIEVAPGNPVYDSRSGCNAIIETGTGTLVKGCGRTVIPAEVSTIGDMAFCGASMPDNLVIPEGVCSIGDNAFSGCDILTLRLPRSLQRLGNSAFSGCRRLGVVEMSGTELHVGWSAFEHCRSLYAVRLPQDIKHESYNVFQHTPYQAVYEREYGKP